MKEFKEIKKLFNEHHEKFTVYAVEPSFVNGKGRDFFAYHNEKGHILSTETEVKNFLANVISWIGKNLPDLNDIVSRLMSEGASLAYIDVIWIMAQAFGHYNHHADPPQDMDTIIIKECAISRRNLTRLITLYQYSIPQPTIIIVLKEDNHKFDKKLFQLCPNGMNVKFIRNYGPADMHKVINTGVKDISSFVDMYAMQCFSACANTERDVIFSNRLDKKPLIKQYSPLMFQTRSKLLCDNKKSCVNDLDDMIQQLNDFQAYKESDRQIANSFLCLAKLNRVFCKDLGGQDILDAINIAKELDNEILLAHTYRYAYFIPGIKEKEQLPLLQDAKKIFTKNQLIDHAIYCENNELVLQFHSPWIEPKKFKNLKDKAVEDVNGLVGIAHIYNNAGVAYLFSGKYKKAEKYFEEGYKKAKREERTLQRLAIKVNMLITKVLATKKLDENKIQMCMCEIFTCMGDELPYLYACYITNLLAIAFRQSIELYKELLHTFPIEKLINYGLETNIMGSGPLIMQLKTLYSMNHRFDIINRIVVPPNVSSVSGCRAKFITQFGFNPAIFYVWL